jgi:hypothetical protein
MASHNIVSVRDAKRARILTDAGCGPMIWASSKGEFMTVKYHLISSFT